MAITAAALVGLRAAHLRHVERGIYTTLAGALALTLVARAGRRFYVRRWRAIRVSYQGGPEVRVPIGFTILEASRFAQVPHASVCGGRGRCSTCRVQIHVRAPRGLR